MLLVFSRWTMWVLAGALFLGCNEPTGPLSLPAAVGRPAEASQGPRVGVIVTRGGEVTIVPSKGKAFPGLPDQQLLRDDRLVTAADSFVVVQLHNGHLVRLGASQNNVVEMLAPFHDPPAADDVEARFVRLLTPAEREDPTLSGAITRVAGWNTRMNASESFAALPASEAPMAPPPVAPPPPTASPVTASPGAASPEAEEQALARDGVQGDAPDDEATVDKKSREQAPPKPAPPAKIGGSRKPAEPRPEADVEASRAKDDAGGGAPAGQSPPPLPPPPRLPGKLKFTPASGAAARMVDLPAPLKAGATALAACAGAGAKISGSVVAGRLSALKVDGKARCQELVGQASTLEDGTFELTVMP